MSSRNALAVTVGTAALSLALYAVLRVCRELYAVWKSPVRDLRGPPSRSWVTGSVVGAFEADAAELFEAWVRDYGPTFRFKSFGNLDKMVTTDPKALNHILSHSMEFYKSDQVQWALRRLVGDGLLAVEGPQHRQQRKMLSPAFGTPQIRSFTKIFMDKSLELRDVLMSRAATEVHRENGAIKVDILDWLGKVSLDIIGLAGFDYAFESLTAPDDQPNELYDAVRSMMSTDSLDVFFILAAAFPPARSIPTKSSRQVARCFATVRRICGQIVAERKAAVLASIGESTKGLEKDSIEGRDLMSLLIKANMAVDVPESARLSDEDLVSQIPTLMTAGHETTSTSLSWTLFLLCLNKAAQDKLRAELRAHPTDTPTMEELNSFPYLDAVVREGLRIHSPISGTERMAIEDCVVPVDNEYLDRHGQIRREIRLNKGDIVVIPIRELQMSKEIWGDDAHEFKPERWENIPEATKNVPGVFSPLLCFLAGPHACIGYRFSLAEAKAILFTLIRAFEFDLAVPEHEIMRKTMIVGHPHLVKEVQKGPQLPMLIRPVRLD